MIRKGPLQYLKRIVRNGREYLYFDCGRTPDGKRRYARLPARSDPSFGGRYAALLGHRSREIEVAKAEMRLSALISLYERSPRFLKLAKNTRRNYSNYIGRFCRALADPVAADVDRAAVTLVLNAMIDTPGARNAMLRSVSALYVWARRNTEITASPCRDIEEHEIGEHEKWPDELLGDALGADDPLIRLSVSLLYYTAQRIGDVCRMAWGDITAPDEEGRRFIHVVQEKTGKELWIRLHRDLAALLDSVKPRFAAKAKILAGKQPNTVRAKIKAWAAERGQGVVPHGLRKNAVIALLEAGCTVAEAASISGQSFQMVEVYARQRDQKRLGSAAILKLEARK